MTHERRTRSRVNLEFPLTIAFEVKRVRGRVHDDARRRQADSAPVAAEAGIGGGAFELEGGMGQRLSRPGQAFGFAIHAGDQRLLVKMRRSRGRRKAATTNRMRIAPTTAPR